MKSIINFREGPEQNALNVLWTGLVHLNARVTELEFEQAKEFRGLVGCGGAWNHPEPLLPSYFFWYATTAYNFLTLFVHIYAPTNLVSEEVGRLFPEMTTWRHKIGAHFSNVFPRKDSVATRENSLLLIVDYETDSKSPPEGRFSINKWIVHDGPDPMNPTAQNKGSCPAWGWSLTEQHEKIEAYLKKHL